ncbi:hypothetical protein JYK14_01970 [Siccirubricoccus sp. KC 17139]|uniref:Uncharacterized protein n=1 Tax=Siccirubricoccus soli TaxID=2899147 RepID=A0ABT1CZ41_9PROT|nr:hypothetical protein [Siccirubricoccus soli]MCO6414943.1 hypothetical protein [Siccirubricoccus soli]MCP2681074.1 hypothetical protein [Siccirubricoccus soli]
MRYICDAPGGLSWFRLETEAEAAQESLLMRHAVEKHYRRAREDAAQGFDPSGIPFIEQDIRRATHIERTMPVFLTLRDAEGKPLVTAMLPPPRQGLQGFRPIVVGAGNSDPFPDYGEAIAALARHLRLTLDPVLCYPYRRG